MPDSKAATLPCKPRPDFPLYVHRTGRWAKKVKGKLCYFGKCADDPKGEAALNKWLDEKDELLAGRSPRLRDSSIQLDQLCFRFLDHKEALLGTGELSPRTFARYKATCKELAETIGRKLPVGMLTPDDFQKLRASMAKRLGPVALGNEIQTVRSVFKFGYEAELLDKPVRLGPGFKKPSAKTLRVNRNEGGPKLFTADQINAVVKIARPAMAAMILLGINGGLGNSDVAELTADRFDLATGWLDYPRVKTGMARRIPLWPQTVKAVKEAIKKRREPTDPADSKLLFIGARGESYVGAHKGYRVAAEFSDLCTKAKVEGRTFYDLRRTFQTIAEECNDDVAVKSIMGHAPASGDMSSIYRQQVKDERLQAAVGVVRKWLFGTKKNV